jgi:hypothetical protein
MPNKKVLSAEAVWAGVFTESEIKSLRFLETENLMADVWWWA